MNVLSFGPWSAVCGLVLVCGLAPVDTARAEPASGTIAAAVDSARDAAQRGDTSLGGDAKRTRFVVGLDRNVQYQVFSLSNPNRVIVELPDVKLQLPAMKEGGAPVGLVKGFRGGEAGAGKNRIVIDVTQPVVVEAARLEKAAGKSMRLALDIVPVDQTLPKKASLKTQPFALGAMGLQPPLPKPALSPAQRAAKAYKPILVIDPGHGGHDSGATKHGTVEKEVVLAFSRTLRDKLNASGRYRVLMTRDTDTFVELDERRAFAERHNANLFLAVHADYAQSNARGATIFSLRDTVANALKKSAKDHAVSAQELKGTVEATSGDQGVVQGFLSDLAEREVDATRQRTSVLSRSLIEYMGSTTELRDNPDQQAAFRVLKTAQFPSVLIELAYVTNKQDAANLKSEAWRSEVADAIVTAVDNYFSQQLAKLPM